MGFSLPQLNSCCCGCTLRTGTLIILWLNVLYGLLLLSVVPLSQTSLNNSTKVEVKTHSSSQSDFAFSSSTEKWHDDIAPLGYWSVLFGIVIVAVSGFALYGVYKELHVYIQPWLVWSILNILIQGITAMVKSFNANTILGELISFLIVFYFWLVVFSHFRVLKGTVRPIQA